jgi:hypothetical protein
MSLMNRVPEFIKTFCRNDSWLKEKRVSSLKKLLFMNGYFDGIEDKFYDKETYRFDSDILFMDKVSHNFKYFDDDDDVHESCKTEIIL